MQLTKTDVRHSSSPEANDLRPRSGEQSSGVHKSQTTYTKPRSPSFLAELVSRHAVTRHCLFRDTWSHHRKLILWVQMRLKRRLCSNKCERRVRNRDCSSEVDSVGADAPQLPAGLSEPKVPTFTCQRHEPKVPTFGFQS